MTEVGAFRRRLLGEEPERRAAVVAGLSEAEAFEFGADWPVWAHRGQVEPPGEWRTWVLMAGRGFGKTRAGAEWVMARVREGAGLSGVPDRPDEPLSRLRSASPPSPSRERGSRFGSRWWRLRWTRGGG